jgi:hypothetical protein
MCHKPFFYCVSIHTGDLFLAIAMSINQIDDDSSVKKNKFDIYDNF